MIFGTVRHPVGDGRVRWRQDCQDALPLGWCVRCRCEIWEDGEVCGACAPGEVKYGTKAIYIL